MERIPRTISQIHIDLTQNKKEFNGPNEQTETRNSEMELVGDLF